MKVGEEGSTKKERDYLDWCLREMKAGGEAWTSKMVMMEKECDLLDRCVFLVRTRKLTTTTPENWVCRKEEFHKIDLRSKSVIPNYLPSTINCVRNGNMFTYFHQVYILGGINPYFQSAEHEHNEEEDNQIYKHNGSSYLSALRRWEPFEYPGCEGDFVNPVVLSHKLYCLGYPLLRPVVHNSSNVWYPLLLPDNLVDKRVSYPAIADPLNNRILVHFTDMAMLYAFYPTPKTEEEEEEETEQGGGEWKCLATKFNLWYHILAVADNIIFFICCHLNPDFAAYDINTSTWLNIEWDSTKCDEFPMDFDFIFNLSDRVMCLAGSFGKDVHFLRFRFDRTSHTDLKFTTLDYQRHNIPPFTAINDIILYY